MKYFVSSDIHGFYKEWQKALRNKGYDKNNPNHCIVLCGDILDRGRQPKQIINYILRNKELPKWASILKYTSTLALTITFLIVLFVLIPMDNYNFKFYLFSGSMPYFHLICPILAMCSFMFFEKHKITGIKDNMRALYYTAVYTIVLLILNITKVVEGPYPFLKVRENSLLSSFLWIISIYFVSVVLSILLSKINNKMTKSIN